MKDKLYFFDTSARVKFSCLTTEKQSAIDMLQIVLADVFQRGLEIDLDTYQPVNIMDKEDK